jgi:hypothetical protein
MQSIANLNERTTGALGELPIRLYVTHVPRKSRALHRGGSPAGGRQLSVRVARWALEHVRRMDARLKESVTAMEEPKSQNHFVDDYW